MTYSDSELQLAAEISYFDLHLILDIPIETPGKKYTVIQAIEFLIINGKDKLSSKDIERLENISDYLEKCKDEWTVVDYRDDNNKNQRSFKSNNNHFFYQNKELISAICNLHTEDISVSIN